MKVNPSVNNRLLDKISSEDAIFTILSSICGCFCCMPLERKEGEERRHVDTLVVSQRLESQHQEKTLLLRGAALASLFTIHKIQASLLKSLQAFHISVVSDRHVSSTFLPPSFGFWFPNFRCILCNFVSFNGFKTCVHLRMCSWLLCVDSMAAN